MVSKNNTQWRLQHEAQRRPHYGIRKLSVGVASVLLSTTFYLGMTSVAHADTANPQQVTDQQAATALNTVQNNANEVKLSTPAASTNVSANTDAKSKAVIDNTVSSTSASSQVEKQAAENMQAVQPTQPTQPAQPANTDSGTTSITGAAAAANNTPTPIDMDQALATIDKQTSDNTAGANANTRFRRAALPLMVLAVNTDPAPNSDYINYTGHIVVHYKDQSGKTLAPDTNISANFTRDWTRNADGTYTYGTWKYADGSISQTGTHINDLAAPTFVNSDATLDHFKFVIPSPKIDGYHNQYAGTNFTLGLLNGNNVMTLNQVSQLDMSSFVEDNKVTIQLVDDASGKVVSTTDANNLDVFQNVNRPDNIIMPIDNYLKLGYYRPVSIDGVPSGISLSSSDNSLALTDQAFQNANLSVDANGHALSSISLQLSNTAAISDWNNKVITIHIAPFTRHQSVSEIFTLNYKFADSNSLKPDDSNYAVDQSRAGQDYHQPVTVKATIDYDQTYSFKTEMSEINNFKASTTSSDNDAASGYFGIESCDLGNGLSKPAIKLGINNWNYIPSDTDSSISQAKYRVGTINITRDTSDNQHTETNSTDSYKYGAMAGFSTALVGVNGHESDYTLTSNGSSLDDSTTFSAPGVVTNWNNSADTITHYLYKQPYKIAIQPVDQSGNAIGSNVDLGTFYYDTMPTSVDISQANPDTSKYQLVDPNATQMGFAVTNALTQTIHNDNGAGWTSSTDGQGNRTHIIRVMFTAKNQKNAHVIVNFVDADNNNQQISSTTFDGVAKSTENVDLKIPSGYVDNSHLVPSSITYPDANSTQTVTIPLNHHHTVVTDPAQTEMTRTITEHYVYEDGPLAGQTAAPDAQVEVAYKRSVTTDDTTGEKTTGPYVFDANRNDDGFTNGYKVISGKWDNLPAGWDVVQANVPTIDGYTADLNRDVTVLNQSDSKIHSSSGTGAAIWVYPQWNMSGTNGTTNSDGESYAYTDANSVNGLYEALPVHTVYYKENTHQVSDSKTVTRTINVTNPDGNVKTTTQTATLTRTGIAGSTSGTKWGDWSTATWHQFNTPVIDGYTPTIAQVPMATVDGNTQNSSINIRYTANDQSTNVVYKDGDKTVKTTPLTGKTGETVDVNLDVPAGYKVVNTPDKSYTFKANGNQDVVVQLGHQTQEITTGEDTEKTVTRDIYTQLEGQEPVKADTQTVTIHRTGTKDLVTGQIAWNPWGTGNMTAYTAPKIDNYTAANPDAAEAVLINSGTQNMSVTFKYRANHEPVTTGEGTEITVTRDIYTKLEGQEAKKVDTQVTTLHRTGDKNLATGKITWGAWSTDSVKAYTAPEIDNYTVENPDVAPAVSVDSATHNMSVTFNYKANHEPVTTGEGTEITVTRDIYTKLEGQEARKVDTETITLHRTGDKNLATGEIKWNPWQSQTMPAYTAPAVDNYTVTNPDAGDATSADGSQDKLADVVFNYKANHEPVTTGEGTEKTVTRDIYTQLEGQDAKKVDTQTITLHRTGDKNLATGQITWSPWTADNMPVYAAPKIDNYTVTNPDAAPDVVIDGSQDNLDKVVFSYTANHEPVTTGEGTEKTVTRDIYTIKEGQAPQKVDTQTVALHRTGDKNLATGQITWNPWTADSMKTYTAPEIKGYTVTNPGAAPTAAIDGTTDNLGRVVFNYIANDQHVNVIYRDDTTGQNVNSVVVNGKTDTTVDFNAQDNVPANYEIKPGADVPTSFAFGTTQLNDQIIPLVHKTQQVDDSKTVTRTINVTNPDGSVKTTKQTVTLTHTGTKDLVTNETKWDDWSTGSFDEFDTPEIKGYTPTQTKVDGTKVTSNTQDSTVNISYTANDQNINIVYKDGDKTIKTTPVAGKTDETVNIDLDVPGGYDVTNTPDKTYTFKPEGNSDVIVELGHKTQEVSDSKTITRTINVTNPDGSVKTTKQSTELTRTGIKDIVTGDIQWNDWSTGSFERFDTPEINGYTPTQAKVNDAKVTSDTQDSTVNISYTANDQSINVVYKDGDKVVKTTPLTGKTDETVNVPISVPDGYNMTNTPDKTYTFKPDSNSDIVVELSHQIQPVNDAKTVTRTINVTNPDSSVKTTKQTTTLTRTGTKDVVTGNINWNDWSTGSFDEVNVPSVKGYTPTQAQVKSETVTSDTQDSVINISYTANDQSTNIVYKDGDKVVKTTPATGKTDETVDINIDVPDGYDVTNTPAKTYTFKPDGNKDIVVELGHKTREVNDSKTITRTINVTNPDGSVKTTKQSVELTRTGTKDVVTGDIQWNNWSTGSFEQFDTPEIKGYTPTQTKVDGVKVTNDTQDSAVDISYTANDQSINIIYKDGDKVVETTPLTGKTNETVDVNVTVPDGYETTNTPAETYTFKPDGNQDITVELKHKTTSVTDAKTVTRTINVMSPDGSVKTTKQTTTLMRTGTKDIVTGNINWTDWTTGSFDEFDAPSVKGYTPTQAKVDGTKVTSNTQDSVINISYTANDQSTNIIYKDGNKVVKTTPVTGKTGETTKIDLDVPDGYHVTNTPDETYTFAPDGNNDIIVELGHNTSNVNDHKKVTRTINVTNPDGSVKSTTQIVELTRTGVKDAVTGDIQWNDWTTGSFNKFNTPEITGYTPTQSHADGAKVTNDTQDSTINITYTANDQSINIVYKDGDKTIKTTPVTGKTDETVDISIVVPDGYEVTNMPGKTYTFKPDGNQDITVELKHKTTSVSDSKTVTRTINVTNPDGRVKTTKQATTLTRQGTKDLVTNDIQWGNWSTGSFDEFNVPELTGYTPSQSQVQSEPVTSDTQDSVVNISYTANDQLIHVVYKDGDKTIKSDPVSGKTGETVKVNINVPDGYEATTTSVTDYTFKPDGNKDLVVELKHKTSSVSDSRTVTRTINVTSPDGSVKTTKQTATLTRTGVKDAVTGQVTWDDWSTGSWNKFDVPTVAGYTPTQTKVAGEQVTSDTQDSVVNVSYTANNQSVHAIYKDGDKTIKSDTINGKTGETVKVNVNVPDGYEPTTTPITDYTFKPDGNQDVVVELNHKTSQVTDSQTVTRTINVTSPDGRVKTTKQTAELTRTGTKDAVTGDITWGDWSTGSWKQFNVPTVAGYTPSQSAVPTESVNVDTEDSIINISYTANEQRTNIKYVDGDQVVKTDTLTGKTGETVTVNPDVPTGYQIDGPVTGDYTFSGDTNPDITIKLKHQTLDVADHKTVTRTINVTDPDGRTKTTVQKADLTRTGIKDLVTDETKWNDWSTGDWNEFDTPEIKGYTPTQAKVDHKQVTSDTQDSVINISYTADKQSVNIIYKDGDQIVKTEPVTGKTGETVKVVINIPDGYDTISKTDQTYTFKPDGNPDIVINLTHQTETVTDAKTVTRTINVTNPDGSVKTTTQKADLTRNGIKDMVTGDIAWDNWSTGNWDEFDVPTIDGYTPSQAKVDAATVTGDTLDTTVNVTYTANPIPWTPLEPSTKPSTNVPSDVPNDTPAKTPSEAPSDAPTPTTPTATGNDHATAIPVTNNHVQPTATAASVQPADNQQSQTNARQLPQTGNERQSGLFAGLIAGIGAITLGFGSRKRKHN